MSISKLELFSFQEVAVRCGVEPRFVEQLVQLGVIEPHPSDGARLATEVTVRVSKLVRLQRDLGVNLEGAAVIVELLDRISDLEAQLKALRRS
jgi:DNA-binding transcriptional MerR regulator